MACQHILLTTKLPTGFTTLFFYCQEPVISTEVEKSQSIRIKME